MMDKYIRRWTWQRLWLPVVVACAVVFAWPVGASPFGQGVFGADVPFGSNTSLSLAFSGTLALPVDTPGSGVFTGTATHQLTVTSNDVVGYRLYVYAPNTTLVNGAESIAASGNSVPAVLAANTWGYNTTGSTTDFMGITPTPAVLKDAVGPFKNGDITTVTYGVKVAQTKGAGDYVTAVNYTVVAKSE